MAADLIVFGEDWGGHPSSTQHLIGHLARTHKIVWVNSIGLRRPRLGDMRRVAHKLAALAGAPDPAGAAPGGSGVDAPGAAPGFRVVAPRAVPWPGNPLAEAANARLLGGQLRAVMAQENIVRPILWTSLPSALPVVGTLGERAVVYYCGDDFGALSGVDHAPVLDMERRLVEKADLVIAASPVLAERFPREKTVLVPHGVDARVFSSPAPPAPDLPDGKVAGFYGSISDWLDVPMLARAAQALFDWTFVFIGPVRTDVSALARLENVRFLGPRPHAALPGYVQHWTVSLIPFRDTPQIRACNPLKLREYLASGTPVAATRFPALTPYAHLVSTIEPGGDLAGAIEAAANQAGGALARLRQLAVAQEGWDRRAEAVETALGRF